MAASYSTDFACHDASLLAKHSQQTRPDFADNQRQLTNALNNLISKAPPIQAVALTPMPQMELDRWSEAKRGVPNAFLRSSLFSATHERLKVDGVEVATLGEIKIVLTGVHFNQKDLDYFLELLHLQRLQPLMQPIQFTASSLLKSLGLSVGNYQYIELKDVIARLQENKIEIRISKKNVFSGSLIERFERDKMSKEYLLWLNPQLLNLFKDGYTQIDSAQRHKLGKHMLAKALHGMYSSHADPYPYKVATIRKLIGSTTQDLSKFRQQLRSALDALEGAGAINDPTIDGKDLVKVFRNPTGSQKHLAKKRLK